MPHQFEVGDTVRWLYGRRADGSPVYRYHRVEYIYVRGPDPANVLLQIGGRGRDIPAHEAIPVPGATGRPIPKSRTAAVTICRHAPTTNNGAAMAWYLASRQR